MKPEIISVATAAKRLAITEGRVRQLIRELGLTPLRIGPTICLSVEDMKALAGRNTRVGAPRKKDAV